MYSNYCTRSEFQSNRMVSAFEVCVSMSNRFQLVDVTLAQNDSGRLRSKVSSVYPSTKVHHAATFSLERALVRMRTLSSRFFWDCMNLILFKFDYIL